jgi:hypothetical protein
MPIQPINFLQAPVQGDPMLSAIIPGLQQGLKLAYAPKQMQQQLQNEKLKNALAQIQLQYAPQTAQTDLDLKKAEALYKTLMTSNPLLGMGGSAGQVGALMYLKNKGMMPQDSGQGSTLNMPNLSNSPLTINPDDEQKLLANNTASPGSVDTNDLDYANMIGQSLKANTDKATAQATYQNKRSNAFSYATAPVDVKSAMVAQLAGAGLYPDEAVNLLSSGKTVSQILKDKGFDPANPPAPDYAPTRGNIDQLQKRRGYLNELNTIDNFVSQGMAPYSSRVLGFSSKQIADAIKNDDPDKQARFIAARGLQPELAAMRANVAGGRVGIGLIREMTDRALGNSKVFESLVRPQVYEKAQQYMSQNISDAFRSAEKNLMQAGHRNVGQSPQNIAGNSGNYVINGKNYTDADIAFTARNKGLTVEQVKQKLGIS